MGLIEHSVARAFEMSNQQVEDAMVRECTIRELVRDRQAQLHGLCMLDWIMAGALSREDVLEEVGEWSVRALIDYLKGEMADVLNEEHPVVA